MGYEAHISKAEAEYFAEYSKWLSSLSPKERQDLAKAGISKPVVPSKTSGQVQAEEMTFPEIKDESKFTYDEKLEDLALEHIQKGTFKRFIEEIAKAESEQYVKESLTRLLADILASKYSLTETKLICIAFAIPLVNQSLHEIGKEIGKTRQAMSTKLQKIKVRYGLNNKLRTEKSRKAKLQYKLSNQRNYAEKDENEY